MANHRGRRAMIAYICPSPGCGTSATGPSRVRLTCGECGKELRPYSDEDADLPSDALRALLVRQSGPQKRRAHPSAVQIGGGSGHTPAWQVSETEFPDYEQGEAPLEIGVKTVAKRLDLSTRQVRRQCESGDIRHARKVRSAWRIANFEFERLLREKELNDRTAADC